MFRFALGALLVLASVSTSACQAAYFATMEQLGVAKREILVDRVEEGQTSQRDAQRQVRTTYEQLVQLTGFQGGDLQAAYEQLDRSYRRSEAKADEVRASIRSIESVARAMFVEWREEIGTISDADMRANSEELLERTRDRYDLLLTKMNAAASRMDPILTTFRDHVLYLKHNLNAQAIQSLESTAVEIEDDVEAMIAEMQASIEEADAFIASLGLG